MKSGVACEKRVDDILIFLGLARARCVDQPAAGANGVGCVLEHRALDRRERREI
jgi:hypothetical protein